MINMFVHIIKMEKQNISAQTIIDHLCSTFTASARNRCSSCGRTGMKYVRKYTRSLTEWHNGHPVDVQIETSLYQCDCGHYHVLLPSVVIPYCLYSLPFILMVLWDYFNHLRTVEEICRTGRFCLLVVPISGLGGSHHRNRGGTNGRIKWYRQAGIINQKIFTGSGAGRRLAL